MSNKSLSPRVLIIRLLEACNAGCFMCSFKFSEDEFRFTKSDAENLALKLSNTEIKMVRFTGGEPLIHKDILGVIRAFSAQGLQTSLISNGSHLKEMAEDLVEAGLSQIILSLDSATERHNKYRNLPGLFESGIEGLKAIRDNKLNLLTRVNTVIGPHNFKELPAIYDLLNNLKVMSWSIIPLKTPKGSWAYKRIEEIKTEHKSFVEHVNSNPGPRLLGFSLDWIGRDDQEISDYLSGHKNIRPRGKCNLVKQVRYYIPKTKEYHNCNCVSHRSDGEPLSQKWNDKALTNEGLGDSGAWLHENGPKNCQGCEPINAALGENKIDLLTDPFGY